MERITWIIIGYARQSLHPKVFLTRITQPNRRSNRRRSGAFLLILPLQCIPRTHSDFCFRCAPKIG